MIRFGLEKNTQKQWSEENYGALEIHDDFEC